MDAFPMHAASVRFGLIIESADLALAGLSEREKLAQRVRARQRRRGQGALSLARANAAHG